MLELQQLLKQEYKDITTQTGNSLQYLGISIETHVDDSVGISQPAYVDKIFDLAKAKSNITPTKLQWQLIKRFIIIIDISKWTNQNI